MTVRVLVVEDDPIAAQAHELYVGRVDGFEAVAVLGTLQEAMTVLGREQIDLVLLDLNLPDGHGMDLVRRLRGSGRSCDVIVVTAAREATTVRQAVSQGVAGYLVKPFTFATFRTRLEQYADYRRQLGEVPDQVGQGDVDAVLAALRPGPVYLPKGLAPETLQQVQVCLRTADEGVSAVEVAEATGMSRVTARRYLEFLAESGCLVRSVRYGGRGRPELEYLPVRSQAERLPRAR